MFPPSFFDHLEDRLNLAVYDTNEEYRMNIRLRDLALSRLKTPLPERPALIEQPKKIERTMSFTGFQPGAIRAALDAAKQKSQGKLNAAMAKLAEAQTKAEAVPEAIHQVAAKMEKEADDALQELAQFTNGGPA